MSETWRQTTLGECTTWASGGTPAKSNASFWTGPIPWVSAKDMKTFRLHDAQDHISKEALGRGGKVTQKGSILLLVRGMTLHNDVPICVAGCDMAFNQDLKAIRPKAGIDSNFLAYWLLANKPNLLAAVDHAGHGTGRLMTDRLKKMRIGIPPLTEQKHIAHILGTLDDKIALNRKLNETLEGMARALFQSWFVDFDPVKAKLAAVRHGRDPERACVAALSGKLRIAPGKPKPDTLAESAGASTKEECQLPTAEELDAAIAELDSLSPAQQENLSETAGHFPENFAESELGLIPEGWEVGSFDQIATLDTSSVKPYAKPDSAWEHYSIPAFDESGFPASEMGSEIKSNKYKVKRGAILASKLNPHFPRTWWPLLKDEYSSICSTEFMQFVPMNLNEQAFLYCLITSMPFQAEIQLRVTGSTGSRQRAKPKEIATMDYLLVPVALRSSFSKKVQHFFELVNSHKNQSRTLAKLRDTLLPKLLSGELPVGEAAETEEAAGA